MNAGFGATAREPIARSVTSSATAEDILSQTVADLCEEIQPADELVFASATAARQALQSRDRRLHAQALVHPKRDAPRRAPVQSPTLNRTGSLTGNNSCSSIHSRNASLGAATISRRRRCKPQSSKPPSVLSTVAPTRLSQIRPSPAPLNRPSTQLETLNVV